MAFFTNVFANRNETKHLPYGEGTLRAEPLAEALRKFRRPATVISESPDEVSSQAIRAILVKSDGRSSTHHGAEPGFARAQPTNETAMSAKGKGAHGGNRPFPPCY